MKKLIFAMLMLMSLLALQSIIHQVGAYYDASLVGQDICLQGNMAFVTDATTGNDTGFIILDITNPVSPVLTGTVNFPSVLYDICIYDQRAYTSSRELGFQIWDVSVPMTPALLSTVDVGGNCTKLLINEDRLYVGVQNTGLMIYNIAGATPVYLGGYFDCSANDVCISEDLAYIADFDTGLSIVNISNPADCSLVGTYNNHFAVSLNLVNDVLFLSNDATRHYLLDVSEPSNPVLLSYIPEGFIEASYINGNYLYIVENGAGPGRQVLKIYDISDPSQPVLYSSYVLPYFGQSISISGNYIYVTVPWTGVVVIDISDVSNPYLISTSHIPTNANAVKLNGDFAYIADNNQRLIQLDISNPADPELVSQYALPYTFFDMAIAGNLAYVTAQDCGLNIFELSEDNPPFETNFNLLASLPTGSDAHNICVSNNLAYIANETNLLIVDVETPTNPFILTQFTHTNLNYAVYLAKYQDYIYLTGGTDPISIIDVSDVSQPVLAGTINNQSTSEGIVIKDHYLYQTNYSQPVSIYDIINPIFPVYIGSIPNTQARDTRLFIYEDYLFVSILRTNNIKCYDITNPAEPVLVRDYMWNLPTFNMYYRNGLLYGCNGEQGFSIIDFIHPESNDDPQETPVLFSFSNYPNPFIDDTTFSYKATGTDKVDLIVYNLKGEVVRHVYSGMETAGTHTINWDGTDDRQNKVAEGIYLSRFTIGDKTAVKKIIRLK